MYQCLESKSVVITVLALLVVALGANGLMGGSAPQFASCLRFADSAATVAHGPTLPPEPWLQKPATTLNAGAHKPAHGPTLPPEPWKL